MREIEEIKRLVPELTEEIIHEIIYVKNKTRPKSEIENFDVSPCELFPLLKDNEITRLDITFDHDKNKVYSIVDGHDMLFEEVKKLLAKTFNEKDYKRSPIGTPAKTTRKVLKTYEWIRVCCFYDLLKCLDMSDRQKYFIIGKLMHFIGWGYSSNDPYYDDPDLPKYYRNVIKRETADKYSEPKKFLDQFND